MNDIQYLMTRAALKFGFGSNEISTTLGKHSLNIISNVEALGQRVYPSVLLRTNRKTDMDEDMTSAISSEEF